MDQIAREGTLAHIQGIPEDVARVFVCAHDIEPEWHVRMQAAFQRHCDSSISKTINFPHGASPADVDIIYRMAFDLKCKGVTVYRDGCRSSQPMALADSEKKHETGGAAKAPAPAASSAAPVSDDKPKVQTETNLFGERITKVKQPEAVLEPRELPPITSAIRVRQSTPFGNMHIQITVDPVTEREQEVFAQLGKGGDIATSDLEAICRMISLWLRSGGRLHHVIKQLSGIGSSLQIPTRHGRIMSLGDGLAQGLKRYTRAKERHGLKALLLGEIDPSLIEAEPEIGGKNGHGKNAALDTTRSAASRLGEPAQGRLSARNAYAVKCPECGSNLDMGEGCTKCHGCGYSQC
jgi:ribonucleoside-diphosphate reductase alpha chain